MNRDEAHTSQEPQNNDEAGCYEGYRITKRTFRTYMISLYVLFILIVVSCIYSFMVYSAYKTVKTDYEETFRNAAIASAENKELSTSGKTLAEENKTLKNENNSTLKRIDEILKQLNDLKKENQELSKKNQELRDDNIALQNSLKMAASAGIKPKNYTKFNGISSRGELERGEYAGKFLGTAYTPSFKECGNNKGITNSGKPIIPGVSLAIDGEYWPFGTIFYIKGLGYTVAMDTGGAIKGRNRFDFAVFDKKFANKLGSKYWDVFVVKIGDGSVDEIEL